MCLRTPAVHGKDQKYRKRMPSRIREVIGLLVQGTGDASLTEVAHRFDRDLSSISSNVAAVRRLIEEDRVFSQRHMQHHKPNTDTRRFMNKPS